MSLEEGGFLATKMAHLARLIHRNLGQTFIVGSRRVIPNVTKILLRNGEFAYYAAIILAIYKSQDVLLMHLVHWKEFPFSEHCPKCNSGLR